jgi:hypothetical protein
MTFSALSVEEFQHFNGVDIRLARMHTTPTANAQLVVMATREAIEFVIKTMANALAIRITEVVPTCY